MRVPVRRGTTMLIVEKGGRGVVLVGEGEEVVETQTPGGGNNVWAGRVLKLCEGGNFGG